MGYQFKVTYDIKHVDKKSALYGLLSSNQTCKFSTLHDAAKFVRQMYGKRTSKYHVVGMPIIEGI